MKAAVEKAFARAIPGKGTVCEKAERRATKHTGNQGFILGMAGDVLPPGMKKVPRVALEGL